MPTRLYETIITYVSDLIKDGILKPGDFLPSERELAEQFQLSRVPVREALKILEFLGVIIYVPGKGMKVQPIEVSSLIAKIFFGLDISQKSIEELFEIRLIIETYAARQSALYRTEEELERIRSMVEIDDETPLSPLNDAMNFHMAVMESAHNKLLSEIYKLFYSMLFEIRKETNVEGRYQDQPLRYHHEIYEAIRDHNAERAETLMHEHLSIEREYLPSHKKKHIK